MARIYFNPQYINQMASELEVRRRSFDEIVAQAQRPGFANSFAEHARTYPYARAGVMFGLTQAGIPAGDPVANEIAEMSLTEALAADPAFALPEGGSIPEVEERAPAAHGEGVGGFLHDGFKSLVRGTFMGLSAPVQELGNVVTSFGEAAFDGDMSDFFSDGFNNLINEAPRSELLMASGELWKRVVNGEIDLTDPSSLRENFWSGDPDFIGSGFLPGGQVVERRERQKENLQLNGQFLTPGRALTHPLSNMGIITPGESTYNWVTGAADAAFQIFGDPLMYIPGGQVAKGRRIAQAAESLSDDAVGAIRPIGSVADGVTADTVQQTFQSRALRTPRHTVDAEGTIWEFGSGSRAGNWLIQGVAQEASPYRMRRAFGGKIDRSLANDLAAESNPQAVAQRLQRAVMDDFQVASLPQLSARQRRASMRGVQSGLSGGDATAPVFRKGGDRFNWNAIAPNSERRGLSAHEPDVAADRFMDFWRASHSDLSRGASENFDEGLKYADEIMQIERGPEAPSQLGDIMKRAFGDMSERTGVEQPELVEILSRDANVASDLRRFMMDESRNEIERVGMGVLHVSPDGTVLKRTLQEGESLGPVVDGQLMPMPNAALTSHLSTQGVMLPDWKDFRRATGVLNAMGPMVAGTAYTLSDAARAATSNLWMPMVLFRAAVIPRILGDSQARMALDGLPSVFRNPLEFVSTLMADKRGGRLGRDLMGNEFRFNPYHAEAMEGLSFSGFTGKGGAMVPSHLGRDSVDFARGQMPAQWLDRSARRVALLAQDSMARVVAERGVDAAVDWMDSPAGRWWVEMMNEQAFNGAVVSRTGMRSQAEAAAQEIKSATNGNLELMEGIARGEIAGVRVTPEFSATTGRSAGGNVRLGGNYLDEATAALKARPELLDQMPQVTRGMRDLTVVPNRSTRLGNLFGDFTEWGFDTALARPENFMARDPAFRATYYRVAGDLLPRLNQGSARDLLDRMRKYGKVGGPDTKAYRLFARDGERQLRQLEAMIPKLKPGDLDENAVRAAHLLAGQEAAAESLNLLYDLTQRRVWEDAASVAAPFVAVWKDTLKTYAHPTRGIITANPQRARRAATAFRSAHSADPDGDGRGFIYEDQNGEEKFAFPDWTVALAVGALGGAGGAAAGQIAGRTAAHLGRNALSAGAQQIGRRAATGVGAAAGAAGGGALVNRATGLGDGANVNFEASVAGLNVVAGEVLPGVGPAVSIPMSYIVEATPQADWLWQQIYPYGRPEVEGGVVESLLPAWMQRFATVVRNDPESQRLFGNTVADVSTALVASGDYATENGVLTEDAKQQLMEDSFSRARALFFVRGMAQFSLPTGPQVEFTAETSYGEIGFAALSQEFRSIRDEHGGDVATGEFIARYGTDLLGVTIPKSRTVRARSFDPEGADWERQNGDLVREFANTIAFFAPDSDTDDFDFQAYNRAIARADLVDLSPEDRLSIQNNVAGSAYMRAQRNLMGEFADTPAGKVYLRQLRAQLAERYPGFGAIDNLPSSINTPSAIAELSRAAVTDDERISALPVTRAIREYLGLREQARVAALNINGATFQQSSADEIIELRDALRVEAARIMMQIPEFAEVWQRVFERELRDDVGTAELNMEPQPFARWQGPAPLRGVTTR